jgi:hypothetical protein
MQRAVAAARGNGCSLVDGQALGKHPSPVRLLQRQLDGGFMSGSFAEESSAWFDLLEAPSAAGGAAR